MLENTGQLKLCKTNKLTHTQLFITVYINTECLLKKTTTKKLELCYTVLLNLVAYVSWDN